MAERVSLTVAQTVDVLSALNAKPWVTVVGEPAEVALATLRRDRGVALADDIEIEYTDPRDAKRRHGTLNDYARAVVCFNGLCPMHPRADAR